MMIKIFNGYFLAADRFQNEKLVSDKIILENSFNHKTKS